MKICFWLIAKAQRFFNLYCFKAQENQRFSAKSLYNTLNFIEDKILAP
ncbi:hypothetical protein ACFP3I_18015 [Chryseobacterium arachidis]